MHERHSCISRTGGKTQCASKRRAIKWMHEVMVEHEAGETCEPEWVSAEHPLFMLVHVGFHGQTEGRSAQRPAAFCCMPRCTDHEVDLRRSSLTTCSGVPPTSAGSRGIATSAYGPLTLLARTQVVFEGVPTYPARRAASGRHDRRSTRSRFSTPRRPLSVHSSRWPKPMHKVHPKSFDLSSPAHSWDGRRADQSCEAWDVVSRERGPRPCVLSSIRGGRLKPAAT